MLILYVAYTCFLDHKYTNIFVTDAHLYQRFAGGVSQAHAPPPFMMGACIFLEEAPPTTTALWWRPLLLGSPPQRNSYPSPLSLHKVTAPVALWLWGLSLRCVLCMESLEGGDQRIVRRLIARCFVGQTWVIPLNRFILEVDVAR